MTDSNANLSRRGFMRAAAGTATATAATGTASAASSNESSGGGGGGGAPPDFGGWFSDVGNYDGTVVNLRGGDATVAVGASGNGGNFAFDPPAIHVDVGQTVTWEWTGEGGSHNVVHEDGDFESELVGDEGFTYEQTFEESGIYNYYCSPHRGNGMKGSVVVGDDFPTVDTGGGAGPSDLPSSAKTLGIATMFVMAATLGLAYFFIKYGGDYGEFES